MARHTKALMQCPACGKRQKLVQTRRHYCDCNPGAPYYMEPVSTVRTLDRIFGKGQWKQN